MSPLDELAAAIGASWPHIEASRREADEERKKIDRALRDRRLDPSDTALVVYGSIARGEWTEGSDVDWTLLVDGEADEGHQTTASQIRDCLRDLGYKEPGRTAVFGGLTFSHELVHRIGG